MKKSQDLIFYTSKDDKSMYTAFKMLNYTVVYVNPKENSKMKKQANKCFYVYIEMNIYLYIYLSFTLIYTETKKCKKFNEPQFIPADVKKFNRLVLSTDCYHSGF